MGMQTTFAFSRRKNPLVSSLRLGVLNVKTFYSEILTQNTTSELQPSTTQSLDNCKQKL